MATGSLLFFPALKFELGDDGLVCTWTADAIIVWVIQLIFLPR